MLSTYRVLLVDNHEAWRRRMIGTIEANRGWQVVGEAADGLAAVQLAEALRPDLILLDLELPSLDGIRAAQRILKQNPRSRILFVSEQQGRNAVEAALATGAHGYLVKSDAGMELAAAMSAVVEGRHFISATLAAQRLGTYRHAVAFCSDEAHLLDEYVQFAEAALKAGHTLVVALVAPRLDALRRALEARDIDLDRAVREGRYLAGNAADAVADWMVDGWPDKARFRAAAASLMMNMSPASPGEPRRVSALGECAAVLARSGRGEAAVRTEELWDEVVRRYGIDAFCGYCVDDVAHDKDDPIVRGIHAAHSAVRFSRPGP